jgi:phosphatidate cytidylyltransferase
MAGADPASPLTGAQPASELVLRVVSALVLAPVAIGVAYVGGWAFVAFWAVAALVVLWEWTKLIVGNDRWSVLMTACGAVLLALVLAGAAIDASGGSHPVRLLAAVIVLLMGMLGVAVLAPRERRLWAAAGIPYSGVLGIAPIVLRSDPRHGFAAIVILFAIVWATDILAYFIGRAAGGPKLAPRISPKKTWSGAIGGIVAAVVSATVIGPFMGINSVFALALLAVVLSAVAQAGDLFESALKRQFGAKDSGHLIPGHGGLMDRLDGFLAAGTLAALIGLLRGGLAAPASGLLVW